MGSLDLQKTTRLLKGNFDILLLNTCSLSCVHCCFLDLPNRWFDVARPKFVWSFDTLLARLDQYSDHGIGFEHLTLLGGEPTMHPRFADIVKALQQRRGRLFGTLRVVSNMTNLGSEILLALASLDCVVFSLYDVNATIVEEFSRCGLLDWLRARTVVEFWNGSEFDVYGEPDPSFKGIYDQQSNWSRCSYKGGCRVISPSGVSYCHMAYARSEDAASVNGGELEAYLNRTAPLDACAVCPIPARREKWKSHNPVRDIKSALRGLALVREAATALL